MLTIGRDAPVQSPFDHRQGLTLRQRSKRFDPVDDKARLGSQPAPQASSSLNRDMEIYEFVVGQQRVVCIEPCKIRGNVGNAALKPEIERARSYPQAISVEVTRQFAQGQVTYNQGSMCWSGWIS